MHVCIVTTEYLPGPGGGVATYSAIMSRLLIDAGHEVTVVVKQEGKECSWKQPTIGPLRVIPLPMVNPQSGKSIWDDPDLYANEMIHLRCYAGVFAREVANRLPELHRARPFDIVLSQDVEAPTYLLQNRRLLFNVMAEVPFIVFIHSPHRQIQYFNDASIYHRKEYHRIIYEEQSMALADGLIAASDYMKAQMIRQMGFADSSIAVIPLPLGTIPTAESSAPQTHSKNDAGKNRRLIYVGRIEPRKGVGFLLKAFSLIAEKYPDVALDLVGKDTLHPALGKSCREVFLKPIDRKLHDRICFLGSVPRDRLWELYRNSHLGVVPSRWEPFSFACQEMMASGLPVVATVEGGMAEMIKANENGFLCPAEDVNALAETLEFALQISSEQRQQIGAAARQRIYDYCDNEKILGQTEQFFKDIINQTREKLAHANRLPLPSNLPFGDHPLSLAHPATRHPTPKIIHSVAAIVTCYNLGAYLDACMTSVLSQGGIGPSVIIVNDGSTEKRTLDALERWREHPSVVVLDFPNGGLPLARQRGADYALAKGYDALMFIDADDEIDPGYLGKAIEVLNRHPEAGAVTAWTYTFGLMYTYWIPPHSQFPLLLSECLSTPSAVIRKEAYLAAGGVSTEMDYAYEDWEFWIALCKTGYAMLTIPEPLLRYRMREGSMSREYQFATREHGRRAILRRHADLHQRFANETQLLTEGYIYFEQAKLHELQASQSRAEFNSPTPGSPASQGVKKKVPIDKKIYRFFKRRFGQHRAV